ncbi:MAG TPA: TlpA disulfide reductase family protein [Streptosporangiaceae bacterium]|jgi:peroxiredoxin
MPRLSRSHKVAIAAGGGFLALLGVLSAVLAPSGSPAGAGASPGVAANRFTLPALGHQGHEVSLSQFAGRPVLINFFSSDCAACKRETPELASLYRAHHGQVAVVGIDVSDSTGAALSMIHQYGVSFPVGADPMAETASAYGVTALPQTFFLDAAHRIVQRTFGALSAAVLNTGLSRMH